MKRALVFVDHTDAGCAALEAARRVAGATRAHLTVVSVSGNGEQSALAAAAARHVRRSADLPIDVDAGVPAVESISLDARPDVAARGLIDGARPDLVIIGSRRSGVDEAVLGACLGSPAEAVLVARPGRRREDHTYRHVAAAGTASEAALSAAKRIAGDDALLTVLGLVEPDATPGRLADVSWETVACAEQNDAEPALVEGGRAGLADWLQEHGVEVVVVEALVAAGDPTYAGIGSDLIARGSADVLVVRGIGSHLPTAASAWSEDDASDPAGLAGVTSRPVAHT